MANGQPPYIPPQQVPQQPGMVPTSQPAPAQPSYPVPPAPVQPVPQQPVYPVQPGAVQPGVVPPQPTPGQPPVYHMPDDAAVLAAYQQNKQEMATWVSRGDGPQFVKWPGPQGQTKWDRTVPIGFESSLFAYILPPWGPGKNIFRTIKSHFWKSYNNPNGTSIGCPGSAACLICQAKDAAMSGMDPQLQKRAKDFGRVRTQHLYNVVLLENPNGHFGKDGVMRPFVLGAGAFLHKAIGDIIEDKHGALSVVDPMQGRPIRLKRNKNGPQDMDIQYAAIAQDPSPLPAHFYPCLQNVWDLDAQDRQPTMDDMIKACQDMGLPLPAGMVPPPMPVQPGMVPAQPWQPAPPPAQPSPYPMSPAQIPVPVGQPQSPTYMPPPVDPYEFPPKDPVVQTTQMQPTQMMPAPVPPPVQAGAQGWPDPQVGSYLVPAAQTPIQAAPPAMAVPPLVVSQPVAPGPVPAPQPTQAIPAPPPPGAVAPQQPSVVASGAIPPAPPVTPPPQVAQQPARQPVAVPQPAVPQPAAPRPPCFGKHNPQDRMCQGCPDQLKVECQVQVGQPVQPAVQPQNLAQLQGQLAGTGQ